MIIKCANCEGRWDTKYLRSDAAHDTEHPDPESWNGEIDFYWRGYFASAGYHFGATVGVLLHCPGCTGSSKSPRNEPAELKPSERFLG